MPKYRCVDCWKGWPGSKPFCADCGSTKCSSMLELQEIRYIKRRYYSEIVFSRYLQREFRSNGNIIICDVCEMRRPSPRCAFVLRTEDEHCQFVNHLSCRNHAQKKVVVKKPQVLKKWNKKNRNPKDMGFVPKKQNRGKMGNFKKKHR